MNKPKIAETVICIDYGDTNIGLAMGRNDLVVPLRVISGRSPEAAIHEITRLAIENRVPLLIMGLPLTAEGKETKQSLKVRAFAKLLKILSKKPVQFFNEYGSSQEAMVNSLASGMPVKKRRTNDQIAAAMILRNYFESLKEKAEKKK